MSKELRTRILMSCIPAFLIMGFAILVTDSKPDMEWIRYAWTALSFIGILLASLWPKSHDEQ